MIYKDDTDEEIAKRVGVQVDVLVAARARFEERMREEQIPEGQTFGMRRLYAPRDEHEIFLDAPDEIFADWQARCTAQRVRSSVMLRSVIHLVLQSQTQPEWISENRHGSWIYQGRWLKRTAIRSKESRKCRITTRIGDGASEALRLRAEKTHTPYLAIVRWGVCLLVNNQIQTREMPLTIVHAVHAMYKASQYCVDPKVI